MRKTLSLILACVGLWASAQTAPFDGKWYRLQAPANAATQVQNNYMTLLTEANRTHYSPASSYLAGQLYSAAKQNVSESYAMDQIWKFVADPSGSGKYAIVCMAAPNGCVSSTPTAATGAGRWTYNTTSATLDYGFTCTATANGTVKLVGANSGHINQAGSGQAYGINRYDATGTPDWRFQEVNEIYITVSTTTGTLSQGTSASANWKGNWTSTATPGVKLTMVAGNNSANCPNNIANSSNGWLDIYGGIASLGYSHFKLLPNPTTCDYYVSGYSFNALYTGSATNMVINCNDGGDQTLVANVPLAVSKTVEEGTDAKVAFKNQNHGVKFQDFVVVLSPKSLSEPPFQPVVPTTISGSNFTPTTLWYNLQFATSKCSIGAQSNEGDVVKVDEVGCRETNEYQWCFVKQADETYKIYNRAYGTSRVLAAAIGASNGSIVTMVADGTSGYTCTWNVQKALTTSSGSALDAWFTSNNGFFLVLNGTTNCIPNKFSGGADLKFWTGGYDGNSAIVPVLASGTIAMTHDNGQLLRNGSEVQTDNKWCDTWKCSTSAQPTLTFGCGKNNMTTATAMAQTAAPYTLNASDILLASGGTSATFAFAAGDNHYATHMKATLGMYNNTGTATITVGNQTATITGAETHTFDVDFTRGVPAAIAITCSNSTPVVIKSCEVTLQVYVAPFINNDYASTQNLFPRSSVERRIPAIATVGTGTNAGRLITVYDYRFNGGDIGGGNISLEIATSDDNGATWTTPAYAKDAEGNNVTHWSGAYDKNDTAQWTAACADSNASWTCAYGDAAIVGDRESSKVLLMAVGGCKNFFASRYAQPNQSVMWTSEDGGDTWSQPRNRTYHIFDLVKNACTGVNSNGNIDGMFIGSGRMMQSRYIKIGQYYRVYAVMSTQHSGGNTRNWVLYTDDFGENWHVLGGTAQCPVASAADEPKAEELPDGSVLLAARGQGGNRNFNIFRYTNITKGEGKWGSHINTNLGYGSINACDGEIYILPVRNKETQATHYIALQSFPHGGGRNNVSICSKALINPEDYDQVSDFGAWDLRYQVYSGSSAYSTMSLKHDGSLGFFFEGAPGAYSGLYCDLTIDRITGNKYEYWPDQDNKVAARMIAEMAAYRNSTTPAPEAYAAFQANPTLQNYVALNRAQLATGTADDYDFDANNHIWPGSLVLNKRSAEIGTGQEKGIQLTASTLNSKVAPEVTWTSSNPAVAEVSNNGFVKGNGNGTAIITATAANGLSTTCTVEVDQNTAITELGNATTAAPCFDLLGRHVSHPTHGLYIQAGRKVIR